MKLSAFDRWLTTEPAWRTTEDDDPFYWEEETPDDDIIPVYCRRCDCETLDVAAHTHDGVVPTPLPW